MARFQSLFSFSNLLSYKKHSVYEHCITTSLEAQKGDSDSYLLKIIPQKRSHYELVSAILGRFKVL